MKLYSVCVLGFGVFLASCGGGGTPVAGIDRGGPPAPAAIVSKGTITGFGSIVVNGIRYETDGATFDVDGNPGTQADLRIGQVVVVQGTIADDNSSATASSVAFNDLVEGPITGIVTATGTITVLGQVVTIDADTSFDDNINPPSIEGLAVTDIVEVSGFYLSDGSISATRIEKKLPGGEFEVTGIVSNAGADTFQINNLLVDYSAAQVRNFPGGAPEDGQLVEAKGDEFGGELVASEVEFKLGDLPGGAGDRAEVEGSITDFTSSSAFEVEGIPVTTNGGTSYVNGEAPDLALNRKIEVEGSIGTDGALAASGIEFKLSNFIRVEGLVEVRNGTQLTILGITIDTNALTRFEDKSSLDDRDFNVNDVNVGDYIEMRGYDEDPASIPPMVVATLVEREDFRGEIAVRGFVDLDSLNDPQFSILGVTIQTDTGTQFRDAGGQSIPAADFFSSAEGRLVEAKGSPANGGIAATEVQFET